MIDKILLYSIFYDLLSGAGWCPNWNVINEHKKTANEFSNHAVANNNGLRLYKNTNYCFTINHFAACTMLHSVVHC